MKTFIPVSCVLSSDVNAKHNLKLFHKQFGERDGMG